MAGILLPDGVVQYGENVILFPGGVVQVTETPVVPVVPVVATQSETIGGKKNKKVRLPYYEGDYDSKLDVERKIRKEPEKPKKVEKVEYKKVEKPVVLVNELLSQVNPPKVESVVVVEDDFDYEAEEAVVMLLLKAA